MKLLKTLSEMSGAPGREEHVRAFIQKEIKDHCDDINVDAMGNLICFKKGSSSNAKKVMIACHMDEIGFYVRSIDDDGFLRIHQLGGFDTRNLFARRVRIESNDGKFHIGNMNPAGKSVHLASAEDRKKIPMISDFAIDVGMTGEEAKKTFRPGDPITLVQDFIEMGDLATGKCMDNRVACWIGMRVLERVKKPKDDLYVVFTVQEEIGIRGATTSAFEIGPDIGIGIDVTLACDLPGSTKGDEITCLGGGAAIKIMDSSMVSDKKLVDEFVDIAEKNNIPFQFEILPFGGTDGAALQRVRSGARALTLSVPCRNVHTVTETIHKGDLEATVQLLEKFLA